jgi:hypothetical protein
MSEQLSGVVPLNMILYTTLRDIFGSVIVAGQGMNMCGNNLANPLYRNRTQYVVTSWGEYYRVCCPFCKENRHRLWINHLYGQPNLETHYPDSWLAVCYNEECTKSPAVRQQLYHMLFGMQPRSQRRQVMPIGQGEAMDGPLMTAAPPGVIAKLSELPATHPARQYVIGRNFDPDWLSEHFRIGYTLDVTDARYNTMRGRLYIPIFFEGALVGWQGRTLYDPPKGGPPKYYFMAGTPRKRILYNYDVAKKWPFVVVVEGVPSVWRIGGPGVASFGKIVTPMQLSLLISDRRDRAIVLLLDPDARDEMEGILGELRSLHKQNVVPVWLPPKYDPADYTHEAVVNFIRSAASSCGVSLPAW